MGSEQSRLYRLDANHSCVAVAYGDIFYALNVYASISLSLANFSSAVRFDLFVINDDESDCIRWSGNILDLNLSILTFCWRRAIVPPAYVTRNAMYAFTSNGLLIPIILFVMLAVANGMVLPCQVPKTIGYSRLIVCTVSSLVECSICLHSTRRVTMISGCGHCYHPTCIRQWASINATCPLCRSRFWE